ncbi:MAG: XRE family transcriptional regulator [Scytonema sp. PMC 1069.18]|nr:XRE family transcriptional regulator [Scytonema sp. PMC 1069.18]MEC4884927.1 XRE family transcriptional regulator [Scytonema sp. PMC 1070.18]
MTLLMRYTNELISTTQLKQSDTHRIIASRILIASSGTTASRETIDRNLVAASEMTTSGVTLPVISAPEITQKAVNELRRLSGLTWDQLAKLFNVSRRSLHSWASGERLKPFNEENLNRLLGTIRYIDRGSASLNRSLLLQPDSNGKPIFDLLVAGEYEAVKRILGPGNARQKPKLSSLSEDARMSRVPPNPVDLVDALQDTIHREVGRSKPARTTRSSRNSSG